MSKLVMLALLTICSTRCSWVAFSQIYHCLAARWLGSTWVHSTRSINQWIADANAFTWQSQFMALNLEWIRLVGLGAWIWTDKKCISLKPDSSAWGALLRACRIHDNAELRKLVTNHLFEIDPENFGHYVQLSSMYVKEGGIEWRS